MAKKTIVSDISEVQLRPMKRGQFRDIREKGMTFANIADKSSSGNLGQAEDLAMQLQDYVLDKIYPEYDFDQLPQHIVADFVRNTYIGNSTTESEAKN